MTKPKTASEERTGSAEGEMTITIEPLAGLTPNWECIVKYADPSHGMGPSAEFVREVSALQRCFHLQD